VWSESQVLTLVKVRFYYYISVSVTLITVICISSQIKPSFGVTAMDVLKFCAESNPHIYVEKAAMQAYTEDEGEEEEEGKCSVLKVVVVNWCITKQVFHN